MVITLLKFAINISQNTKSGKQDNLLPHTRCNYNLYAAFVFFSSLCISSKTPCIAKGKQTEFSAKTGKPFAHPFSSLSNPLRYRVFQVFQSVMEQVGTKGTTSVCKHFAKSGTRNGGRKSGKVDQTNSQTLMVTR